MKPIKFPEANVTFILGVPGRGDLPAYNDGTQTISVWQLTPEDLEKINETKQIYLSVAMGKEFPPVSLFTDSPFFKIESKDAFHEICYLNSTNTETKDAYAWVYNNRNADAPKTFTIGGDLYLRDLTKQAAFKPNAKLSDAPYQFDVPTQIQVDLMKTRYPEKDISDNCCVIVKTAISELTGLMPCFNG